ncbi:diphthine--ammonia ligase [bacterium]|nr:MAG: diphthine--ammonia ligase [bacterium]
MSSLALCSWSGGKDCALAVYRARQNGFDVRFLLAMMDESGEKSRSHSVPLALLQQQAESMGCELITRSASWQTYEREFVAALNVLRRRGATHAIFGDIDLQAHRDWEEAVCQRANIEPVLPLWNEPRTELAAEVLRVGFKAKVVCVAARWLDKSFCGRDYNAQFVSDLPPSVDACGENGEFHTFVTNGPIFDLEIKIEIEEIYEYTLPPTMGEARFFYARLKS